MPTRLRRALLFVGLLAVGRIAFPLGEVPAGERPNIILVMADDLGWSDIGCYGGEIPTPHIDSLAARGIRFTQFYNNAICGPTRASLLTGLYCQQVGHRGDRWNEPKDYQRCVLISELLQAGGYRTAMVGKWQGRDAPLDRGFDRFFGPMCQGKISYFDEVQHNPYYLDRKRVELPDDFYLTEALNDYAVQFLRESVAEEQPFFLYVAHIAPHWPLHARPAEIAAHRETYRSGWEQIRSQRLSRQHEAGLVPDHWSPARMPAVVKDWQREPQQAWQAERMAVYAAQFAAIDQGLGQLLDVVDQAGCRDNTLIVFLSDNGAAPDGGVAPSSQGFGFSERSPNLAWRKDGVPIRPGSGPDNPPGPHDTFAAYGLAWATASNTPLRGTKLGAYEGGIRTPLVIQWPRTVANQGSLTEEVGHVFDLPATFLEMAGVSYPTEFRKRRPLPLEGRSLLPVLEGRTRRPPPALCWSVPRHDAVRMGRWKAIRPRPDGAWQLYDLENDGTESTDLAEHFPQRVEVLAEQYRLWEQRMREVPAAAPDAH